MIFRTGKHAFRQENEKFLTLAEEAKITGIFIEFFVLEPSPACR